MERAKQTQCERTKYWEIIADNLSKAGWSWGCVSAIDSNGFTARPSSSQPEALGHTRASVNVVIQVPDRRLPGTRVVKHVIRSAVTVKVGCRYQAAQPRRWSAVSGADKRYCPDKYRQLCSLGLQSR